MPDFFSAQDFDPMEGKVPSFPIPYLPKLAARARKLLVGRTSEEVRNAQEIAESWVDSYFDTELYEEIARLREQALCEDEEALRFFDCKHGELGSFFSDMEWELDIPTRENTSRLEVLDNCLPWFVDTENGHGFLNGKDYEYLAATALDFIEQAVCSLQSTTEDAAHLSMLNDFGRATNELIRATTGDRVVFEQDALLGFAYDDTFKATEALFMAYECKAAADREDAAAEAESAAVKSTRYLLEQKRNVRLKNALNIRHKDNRTAKDLVCGDWETAPKRFPSSEDAANYYVTWLEDKGLKFKWRTVRDWILKHAKKIGVKWR